MSVTDVDEFLAHYGRKGMKWGVVRSEKQLAQSPGAKSPPKAANEAPATKRAENKTAKREEKAQKFDTTAAELKKTKAVTEKKLEKASNPISRHRAKSQIKDLEKEIETAEKDAAAKREGRLSTKQKKVLIGTAVVGGLLLVYGTQRSVQSGQFTSMATKGKAAWGGDAVGLFKRNPKFADKTLSADDIVKNVMPGINPGYGDKWGTNMNCRRATFAYEMRRRGYDVQATRTSNGMGQTVGGLFKATKPSKEEQTQGLLSMLQKKTDNDYGTGIGKTGIGGDEDSIFGALSKQPERSRGELGVLWKGPMPGIPGGGHSVAYEIINGKAHIFDNQTGKEYKQGDTIFSQIESAAFTRLDNVELNESFLTKWVK